MGFAISKPQYDGTTTTQENRPKTGVNILKIYWLVRWGVSGKYVIEVIISIFCVFEKWLASPPLIIQLQGHQKELVSHHHTIWKLRVIFLFSKSDPTFSRHIV